MYKYINIPTGNRMRTYKRKKQEYQLIEDIEQRCRLCLEKAEDTVPIFKEGQDNIATLALRIMLCVGIEVKQEELLPNKICNNCSIELENCYKFRKKCEASYQKQKHHLVAIKDGSSLIKMEDDETVYLKENLEEAELVVIDSKNEKIEEMQEIQVIEQSEENGTNLQTFLKSILVDLNILANTDEGLIVQEQVSNCELETGDDDIITFELIEEDDDEQTEPTPGIIIKVEDDNSIDNKLVVEQDAIKNRIKKKSPGWWCKICGKALSSASAGARHAAVHSGLRPHACHTCGRTFAQKAVRDRHMLVHQERRPFACGACDKSFTQRAALAAHARHHAKPRALRLHACPHCDKHFLYASGLSRHLFVHAGRVYSCNACCRRFTDRSSLARHLRNKHGDKTELMDDSND